MMLKRGWKSRRAAADARREDRAAAWSDDRAEVRRQRAALAEKARLEAEALAAAREAEIRIAVTTCPCCAGRGHASVIEAATLVDAAERYREAGWRPSPATVARLMTDSFMVDRNGDRVDPVQATETITETPAEPMKALKTSRRQMVTPPFLDGTD